MAKKKRRRRPPGRRAAGPPDQPAGPPSQSGISPTAAARRDRKEEARQARQAALRRFRRQRIMRRGGVWAAAGIIVLFVVLYFTNQAATGSGKLSAQGASVAAAAGCTAVEKPQDQGRQHLPEGGSYTYTQQPPTSGPHDPVPLPGGVYSTPQGETHLVHSLEHGAVELYYQSSGPDELPSDVVDALKTVANGNGRVIMTPAPQALSAPLDAKSFTVSLAFASWDRLLQCPKTITATEASSLARAWVKGFVNASSAPEHGSPL